jgi:hypothetical protein
MSTASSETRGRAHHRIWPGILGDKNGHSLQVPGRKHCRLSNQGPGCVVKIRISPGSFKSARPPPSAEKGPLVPRTGRGRAGAETPSLSEAGSGGGEHGAGRRSSLKAGSHPPGLSVRLRWNAKIRFRAKFRRYCGCGLLTRGASCFTAQPGKGGSLGLDGCLGSWCGTARRRIHPFKLHGES